MRREWIEIFCFWYAAFRYVPSPSMRREWIEMELPVCRKPWFLSPSMRREWIEMFVTT